MTNVLLVDSYDSYTYNLYQLILDSIPGASIVVVRNDQLEAKELGKILDAFDFVVIGPGPGDPRNPQDIGFLLALFDHDIPILGVCLGFQLLCLKYSGTAGRLRTVKHGQVSRLETRTCGMYPAGGSIHVTRYHSISVNITQCSDLLEVGWVTDASDNGHVPMSVMHINRPHMGVQYHPESACSEGGSDLIKHFDQIAKSWNDSKRQSRPFSCLTDTKVLDMKPASLIRAGIKADSARTAEWRTLDFIVPGIQTAELLGVHTAENFIMLDAAAKPSRYSVLASISPMDKRLSYTVGQDSYIYGEIKHSLHGTTIFEAIAKIMHEGHLAIGPDLSPFWGGLVGYMSYEVGVESLNVKPLPSPRETAADINMIFVHRSIVLDHEHNKTYVQSIRQATCLPSVSDVAWLDSICDLLVLNKEARGESAPHQSMASVDVLYPSRADYVGKVSQAQDFLAEGQSYELCVTDATRISCEPQSSWDLYQRLRQRNPSPFAGFMRLPGVQLLSSSPERFLSWSRTGACELRPIKGTVRKTDSMTRSMATTILQDPKEIAENLMIVDLIRHDLHQIAQNVSVPSLMQVEEYETVFQLVSVITGQVESPFTGLDVLSRSLPPGSMTGAPKKRSVELLQKIEGRRRGIYSGICGYLSVCGGGDWSVVIRSAFRYEADNPRDETTSDVWWIGAGGAVTALSDPDAEWQEMLTKLESTLPCFGSRIPPVE